MEAPSPLHGFTLSEAVLAMKKEYTRVLVAEDDPEMRSLIVQELQQSGFDVVSAADGLDALNSFRHALAGEPSSAFDVVVADLRMPGLTGMDLLAALQRTYSAPPFILITAFGSVETHAEALRLGAWTVLDKPFCLDQLQAAIRNAA